MRANLKLKLVTQFVGSCLMIMLAIGMTGCEQATAKKPSSLPEDIISQALATTDGPLSEVNTPDSIARLAPSLEKFQPQVQILSPQRDQILTDDRVTVKLQVSGLPIFKSKELGLGNHLHVILDRQTYQPIYDLSQPLVFKKLSAGTHSLRVFASRSWHESFKNEGAYAQTTFHVLTKTADNNPNPQQPLLTYSRPTGTYGTEPIMLDYYLTNAPTHLVNGSSDSIPDWRIRATVNDQQFIIDRWTPVYLQGFKQGKNWVRLELVDDRGILIPNVYNDTYGIITYDPQANDSLAKLISGKLSSDQVRSLVDPNYILIEPAVIKSLPVAPPVVVTPPVAKPVIVKTPQPIAIPTPDPTPVVVKTPQAITTPPSTPEIVAIPKPVIQPAPNPVVIEALPLILSPNPNPIQSPISIPSPESINSPTPATSVQPPTPSIEQPKVLLSPTPILVVINPPPIPAVQPAPVVLPTPVSGQIPVNEKPFVPATSISRTPTIRSSSEVAKPKDAIEKAVEKPEAKTWQTKAIELIQLAGVKTRAFTHTIPGKAQRFGNNVQTWFGNVMETVQSWRGNG